MKIRTWRIGAVILALVALAVAFSPTWQDDWSDPAPLLKTQLFRP